jgi:hypothetical protein
MSLDRIRKLFALSVDQQGTPEGETAARIARELMRDRCIELAQLAPGEREEVDPFVRQRLLLGGPKHWRCRLLSVVASHCECVAGYRPGSGKGSLYGRRSAVEVAEYLFVLLSRQLTLERAVFMAQLGPWAQDPEGVRRTLDFTGSAVMAIEIRLKQLRDAELSEDPETFALVHSSSRGLGSWMERSGQGLKAEPPFPFAYSEDGYKAGYRLPIVDGLTGRPDIG